MREDLLTIAYSMFPDKKLFQDIRYPDLHLTFQYADRIGIARNHEKLKHGMKTYNPNATKESPFHPPSMLCYI
jgi:hypothetical protein